MRDGIDETNRWKGTTAGGHHHHHHHPPVSVTPHRNHKIIGKSKEAKNLLPQVVAAVVAQQQSFKCVVGVLMAVFLCVRGVQVLVNLTVALRTIQLDILKELQHGGDGRTSAAGWSTRHVDIILNTTSSLANVRNISLKMKAIYNSTAEAEDLQKNKTIMTTTTDNNNGNDFSVTTSTTEPTPIPTFSACLLVKDENHRLNEWIAYHYFALNLRYLVIAVDPNSFTSPSETLQRWNNHHPEVTIILWGDDDIGTTLFGPSSNLASRLSLKGEKEQTSSAAMYTKHLRRQSYFYQACAWHMKQHNRTWTSFHDADEYIHINGDVYGRNETKQAMRQPGGVLRLFLHYRLSNYSSNAPTRNNKDKRFWYDYFQKGPCMMITRSLFGSSESSEEEVNHDVPSIFAQHNLSRNFETLRWRSHTKPNRAKNIESFGKSILDVSHINSTSATELMVMAAGSSPHRAIFSMCPTSNLPHSSLPIVIAHYLGSWESYMFARVDLRHSRTTWEKRGRNKNGRDDSLRPWLQGFVDSVGEQEAFRLLQGVGRIINHTAAAAAAYGGDDDGNADPGAAPVLKR